MVAKHNMPSPPRSQRGVVVVFATLAMAVLIGAGALALDVGNLVLSKSKLQNLADSAALGAAKMIAVGGDHNEAITMGNQIITDNLNLNGFNSVLLDEEDLAANVTFEFSEELPFASSTATDAPYVRVRIENVDVPDFLVALFNIDLDVRASAVAGPSTTLISSCNVTPLSICKGPLDPEDPSNNAGKAGYKFNDRIVLKAPSSNDSPIGSGNFMPIALGSDKGSKAYAEGMAGGYDTCPEVGDKILTEPGNMIGPSLAIDTRFGIYKSTMNNPAYKTLYKADHDSEYDTENNLIVETNPDENAPHKYIISDENNATLHDYYIDYNDEGYQNGYAACLLNSSCGNDNTAYYRRLIAIPVLDCDSAEMKSGGRMSVPALGLACFYLVHPMTETKHKDEHGANNGTWLVGQFIKDCTLDSGEAGNVPDDSGPYKIVLFKDPDSEDS